MKRLSFAISLQLLVITTAVPVFGQTRPGASKSAFADWNQQRKRRRTLPSDDGSRSVWRVAYTGK
jgi:hypothetical protein